MGKFTEKDNCKYMLDATRHYQSLFASDRVLACTFNDLRKLVEIPLAVGIVSSGFIFCNQFLIYG